MEVQPQEQIGNFQKVMLPHFVEEAHNSARFHVYKWIRKTLREVAIQSLKNSMSVVSRSTENHPVQKIDNTFAKSDCSNSANNFGSQRQSQQRNRDESNSHVPSNLQEKAQSTLVVKLSDDAIESTKELCQLVSRKWSEKLIAVGHFRAAEWIQTIAHVENDRLYLFEDDIEQDQNTRNNFQHSLTTNYRLPQAVENSIVHNHEMHMNDSCDYSTTVSKFSDAISNSNRVSENLTTTALMNRLRMIGYHDILSSAENNFTSQRTAIKQIDEIGLEFYGRKFWSIIQSFCQKIPSRLYNNVTSGSTDTMHQDANTLSLLPSTIIEKQVEVSNESLFSTVEKNTNNAQSRLTKMEQLLVNRKRKWRYHSTNPKRLAKKKVFNAIDNHQTKAGSIRKPCPNYELSFSIDDIKRELTENEKMMLNSYVHDYHRKNYLNACTMLGDLRDVGQFHYFYDFRFVNRVNPLSENSKVSEKQIRRRQRESVRERLGNHFCSTVDNAGSSRATYFADFAARSCKLPNQRSSRILPTIEHNAFALQNDKMSVLESGESKGQCFYYDLDMGHTFLEVVIDGKNQYRELEDTTDPDRQIHTKEKILCSFQSIEAMLLDEEYDYSSCEVDECSPSHRKQGW